MEKYIIAPPAGSQTNALGAKDRPWEEVHANRYPGINEYLAESTGYGIVSGCEPSISGLTVKVGAGVIHLADGTRKEIARTNITLDNADPTNPRIDLVYIDSTGAVAKVTGTASASPVVSSVPAGGISVCNVNVAAGATTGTITAKRDVLPRFYNTGIVNVKDFGAVGDGVTDDSNAISNCIKYARDNGMTVIVPPSTYLIATPIRIENNFNFPNIIGSYGTIFHIVASVGLAIVQGSGGEIFTKLSGIKFVGDGTNIGVQLESCCGYTIENSHFSNFATCVKFYNHAGGFTETNIVRNCDLRGYTKAAFEFFRDGSEMSFHGNRIELCTMSTNMSSAVHVYIGGNCFLYNVYFDLNCWGNNTIFYRDNTSQTTNTRRFVGEVHLKIEGSPAYIFYSELASLMFLYFGSIIGTTLGTLKWHNVAPIRLSDGFVLSNGATAVNIDSYDYYLDNVANGDTISPPIIGLNDIGGALVKITAYITERTTVLAPGEKRH